jgi:hypothetical protein
LYGGPGSLDDGHYAGDRRDHKGDDDLECNRYWDDSKTAELKVDDLGDKS